MDENEVVNKIYCSDRNDGALTAAALMRDNDGGGMWPMMAMMGGGMNGQWNNPFIYLVWMMFAQRMWGANGLENGGCNPQIAALQNQMQYNHNSDLILQGIGGNENAIREVANRLGCDLSAIRESICDVRGGIDKLAGQIGFSAERVINAVQSGNSSVISKLQDCCCEQRLATCQQTNLLQSAINTVAVGQERGFAQIGYDTQKQTCDIIAAGDRNTQRIVDVLNNHWQADLQQRYNDARLELSQLRQNATLIAALKTTTTPAA